MKLGKALRRYYMNQVEAASLSGGEWRAKTNGRTGSSLLFNIAFHAVLVVFIVSAMLLGRYQPSHLNRQMGVLIDHYNIEVRLADSLESLIKIILEYRKNGGDL